MKLWHSFALGVVILLAALLLYLPLLEAPALPMDEGTLLVYPEQIARGKLPYRDFETFYGPGNLHFLQGAYSIFGTSLTVERLVGLCYRLLILTAVFVLGRRRSLSCAFLCTVVAGVVSFIQTLAAFAWVGGVAALLWCLLLLAGPPQTWRAATAGALGGVALLYRQDLAPRACVDHRCGAAVAPPVREKTLGVFGRAGGGPFSILGLCGDCWTAPPRGESLCLSSTHHRAGAETSVAV
jgi:hypothetical protein